MSPTLSGCLGLLLATTFAAAADPPKKAKPAEAAEMLWLIIAKGGMMSGTDGWFHPGESRYGWRWLFKRFDADKNEKVTKEELKGPPELFARLDRNRDGNVTQDDFDWSPGSAFLRQSTPPNMWFRMHDQNSNGRISREEWEALFQRASKGRGFVLAEDLRELFPTSPPPRPPMPTGGPEARRSPDMPSRSTLFFGLLSGEIGSFREGPALGEPAPDFKLRTHDGTREVQLSDSRGKKPVVLVFGSFT